MEEQRKILADAGVPLHQLFFDKLSRRQIAARLPADLKDRAEMVLPTTRTTPEVIYVAAFRVLGWTMGDIADTLAKAARRNASVFAVQSGRYLPLTKDDAAMIEAIAEIEAERVRAYREENLERGREATKRHRDRKWDRVRKATSEAWALPETDPEWKPAKEIAFAAGVSVRTLQNRLGNRRDAQWRKRREK